MSHQPRILDLLRLVIQSRLRAAVIANAECSADAAAKLFLGRV
jgi:hypothetical protein